MSLNLFQVIKDGTKAVPSIKYALGIAGIAAVIALIISFKIDLRIALWGTITLLGLMILLVVFAKLTQTTSKEFEIPVKILMWAFVFLFISISTLLTSSVFFKFPVDLQFILTGDNIIKINHFDEKTFKERDHTILSQEIIKNSIKRQYLYVNENSTFTFINKEYTYLSAAIEKKSKTKYRNSSNDNLIDITYTGEIEKKESSNLYVYTGGRIKIVINNNTCYVFEHLYVPSTFLGGNNKENVESTLRKQLKDAIENNKDSIVAKIIECIN